MAESLISILVTIIIVGIVLGLLLWLVSYAAAQGVLPAPFVGVAKVLIALVGVLILIAILLGWAPTPMGHLWHR